jgi:hypothetical protein
MDGRSGEKAVVSLGFLLQCKSYSSDALLQGTRHAVVETRYSRAHRIGLDGVSCLLDGLRKNLSFGFFVVVVIGVLVYPALEVVILAEEQLQGFGVHVRRRSIEKLGIEF